MPFLKKKLAKTIEKVQEINEEIVVKSEECEKSENSEPLILKVEDIKREAPDHKTTTKTRKIEKICSEKLEQAKKSANSRKNIVKNFGRAMIIFSLSKISEPYLAGKLKQHSVSLEEFRKYLSLRKENMDGISSLRGLLLVNVDDTSQEASIKKVFQYSCEVFIKFFSINWIFHSKLGDKMAHIQARFKILRRIQDPEHFTYLKCCMP